MTVTTIFATAPGGNSCVFGQSTTYATARSTAFAAFEPHYVGQLKSGSTFQCFEGFVIFDTSGIPDTDSIDAVTLSLDGDTNDSATDFNAIAATSTYDGGQAVVGDWVAGASLSALTTLASWNSSGYSAGYNAFTSVAAFLAAINATGNTSIILYSDRHSGNNTPAAGERVAFTDADTAGTTSDPKLDITHTAAAGTVIKDLIGSGLIAFPR